MTLQAAEQCAIHVLAQECYIQPGGWSNPPNSSIFTALAAGRTRYDIVGRIGIKDQESEMSATNTTYTVWASQAERQIAKHFGMAARKFYNLHRETMQQFWKNGASPENAAETIIQIHMDKARGNRQWKPTSATNPTINLGTKLID